MDVSGWAADFQNAVCSTVESRHTEIDRIVRIERYETATPADGFF
jgi:hypothetical protein